MVSSDAPADDLAAGVGAWATVQKPSTGFYDVSLFQVGARMGDNYVEVGWQVNLNEWGDYAPRLFTNAAGAGQQPCREDIYDCFVSTSTLATHGMLLNPGEQHFFGIVHYGSAWWVEFDSQAFGYFPDSLWNGKFTEAEEVAWQGEAISRFSPVCADMGNGVMGDDPSQTAAQVSTIIVAYYHHEPLYGWEWPTNTRVWESHPDWYRVSDVDDTMSFRFGGPGAC